MLVIFMSDVFFNSKTDIFRNVISFIINQCEPRRPKVVSASRAAQESVARCNDNKRFACVRCAAGGHFVSAVGALWASGVTLIN